MQTEIVWRQKMLLKTTVTASSHPLAPTKLRSQQMTRKLWKVQSKIHSSGLTQTLQQKRRNTKRSARPLRVSPCLSFRRWPVERVACQVLEECRIWVEWLIWEELLRRRLLLAAQRLRKLIEQFQRQSL